MSECEHPNRQASSLVPGFTCPDCGAVFRAKATPLEEAIERKLRQHDPHAPEVRELDAEGIARVVVRHWGDDAPAVLTRALELARARVASWTPKAPAVAAEDGG